MFSNLKELIESMPTEEVCREYLAKQRWPDGKAVCPYCNCGKCYVVNKGKRYKCSECRLLFSVKVGTVFEDSNIPLSKWFLAVYLIGSHKKGISSYQVAKDCGVTQKSGWFMLHRIREMMRDKVATKLDNIVEADEVYMGGKVSNMSKSKRKQLREEGRTYDTKTMVMGMIERGGNLKLITIGKPTNVLGLQDTLRDNVDKDAVLITDSLGAYTSVGKTFAGHEVVNHNEHEYVRDAIIHTNTVEGAFSHFKRSIYGIYHFCTPKHLSRYADETMLRYNTRAMKDPARFNLLLQSCTGRLSYKQLIEKKEVIVETDAEVVVIKTGTAWTKNRKPVFQLKNGKVVAEYPSIKDAALLTGIRWQNISRCLIGRRKSTGGFEWKYAADK